jgi:hypothetical protein
VLGLIPCVGINASDEALLSCAKTTSYMLTMRPDISQGLMRDRVKFVVMAESEVTEDVAEHESLIADWPNVDWNVQRGLGATSWRPAVSAGEENIMCKGWPADVYRGEMIMVHEFAHTFSGTDLVLTNPTCTWWAGHGADGDLWEEMNNVFEESVTNNNLWSNTYAGENSRELWAEAVQAYFDCDQYVPPEPVSRTTPASSANPFLSLALSVAPARRVGPVGGDGIHNNINTRAELMDYDEELYNLVKGAFNVQDGWRPTCGCDDTDRRDYPLDEFRAECSINEAFPKDDDEELANQLRDGTSPGDILHGVTTCFEAASKGACVSYPGLCECACATASCPSDLTIPRDGDEEECNELARTGGCGDNNGDGNCECACTTPVPLPPDSSEFIEPNHGSPLGPDEEEDDEEGGIKKGVGDPVAWFTGLSKSEKEIFFGGFATMFVLALLFVGSWCCCCRDRPLDAEERRELRREKTKEKMVQMKVGAGKGKGLTAAQVV